MSNNSGNSNSPAAPVNTVTTNGTSSGSVNGTTESPHSTPGAGHKSPSLKSNSSASSGEVGTYIFVLEEAAKQDLEPISHPNFWNIHTSHLL